MTILLSILAYLLVLTGLSRLVANHHTGNEEFFHANRKSPWPMVAFGMIGASISGVTFVSVPGMVETSDMTYLQTCLGFILGYAVVAFVLLPVYYRLNLTTIYTYLQQRLGQQSYRTGAAFFLLSKLTGTAVKFYLFCMLLHRFAIVPMLAQLGLPGVAPTLSFVPTAVVMVLFIWLYSHRGGIKTLVVTDVFQTTCLLLALLLIIWQTVSALGLSLPEAVRTVANDSHSRVFVMDDWLSRQYFWKQFLSGIFIVIVMTGLDQDMMQKNLTCRTLREAQKDMCCYGVAFVPVNWLLLSLGILLTLLAQQQGLALPQKGDELLPLFAATGRMGGVVTVCFTIGIMAASLSTADSALTSLTTSCCVDLFQRRDDEQLRHRVHLLMSMALVVVILAFHLFHSSSLIDAVYTLVSYTYGPLLGLFAYGLLTPRRVNDKLVPYIAVASPLLCLAADSLTAALTDYRFGYELLLLNGLLTFSGLWFTSPARQQKS